MKDREEVLNFLVQLESKYPVETWEVNDICVWPYLRNKLYFLINLEIEKDKRTKNYQKNILQVKPRKGVNRFLYDLKNYFKSILFFYSLKTKKYLFFEAPSHRINFNNKPHNKFFDTIINDCNLKNESYIFDYLKVKDKTVYNKHRVNINKQLEYYESSLNIFKRKIKIEFKEKFNLYNSFYQEFKKFNFSENFYNSLTERRTKYSVFNIYNKSLFFEKLYKLTKPKEIFILCYYNSLETYAIVLAASRLNLRLVEMQHGPQSNIQSAYSNWVKVTDNNFKLIPKVFWNWDLESNAIIKNWSKNLENTSSFIGGNIWVDYWKSKSNKLKFNNYVLYTLQSLSLEILFPETIIKAIKESKYLWMLRLHPRQLAEKDIIIQFLKDKKVFDKVNIEEATNLPLPLLMNGIVY